MIQFILKEHLTIKEDSKWNVSITEVGQAQPEKSLSGYVLDRGLKYSNKCSPKIPTLKFLDF